MDRSVRILIADDQPRTRQSLKALLSTWSEVEVVSEAANGLEAVQRVEECQPDVALLDVRMPVMDGLKAARIIKNRRPEIRIVVLTMYASHQAAAQAAGADTFVLKGCPAEELLKAILNLGEADRTEEITVLGEKKDVYN